MITKKEILDSELMRLLIEIRLDSAYRLLSLKGTMNYPKVDEEGATGDLDNKGSLFIPGGFVFEDSNRRSIKPPEGKGLSIEQFRKDIVESMKYDNATLIYPEGVNRGINLDNGFFSHIASNILGNKEAASKRKLSLGTSPPQRITSDEIAHSYTPGYVLPPYGSRNLLGSCISACLAEPLMYYSLGKEMLGLRNGSENKFWEGIKNSKNPVLSNDGKVLSQPYAIICHNTRYKEEIVCGIIRILGIGKFGEFATLTFEEPTLSLMKDIEGRTQYHEDEILASYNGYDVVGVLRFYPRTNPGKRVKKGLTTTILSNEKDLGLDLEGIKKRAFERYKLSRQ